MAGVLPPSLADYPLVLTEADWLRKSGAQPSVLQDELAQGERLHGRIEVAALLPSTRRPRSLAALERAVDECRDYHVSRVQPLQDQLRTIARLAKRVEGDMTRSRQGAAAAAAEISRTAQAFAQECGAVDWSGDYEATRAVIASGLQTKAGQMVDDAAARLIRAARAYEASPQRAADWQALIRPEGHRLSQIVSALPDYRSQFWHKFKMFQSFDIQALKLEGVEEIDRTKRLAVLHQALRQTEAIADHPSAPQS